MSPALRVSPLVRLVRPLNVLITFLSIVAATVIAGGTAGQMWEMVLAGAVGALVAAGANAINDLFDVEIDRVNRPDRPLPSGAVSKDQAMWVWKVGSAAGVLLAIPLGVLPFAIAVAAVAVLYAYSSFLKSRPLFGNVAVALMTGLAFIFGGAVVGSIRFAVMPAIFAFLVNLAREVVKDIEDREGDSAQGAATLPLKYGIRPARIVTTTALLVLVGATVYAYLEGLYDDTYLGIVMVTNLLLSYVSLSVWTGDEPARMHRLSTTLKVSMVFGLAALFLGRNG